MNSQPTKHAANLSRRKFLVGAATLAAAPLLTSHLHAASTAAAPASSSGKAATVSSRRKLGALENIGADAVALTPDEFSDLTTQLSAITIQGLRLPETVLQFSGVEAPAKT